MVNFVYNSLFYLSTRRRAVVVLIGSVIILFTSVQLSPSYNPDLTHGEFKQEFREEMVELDNATQELKDAFKELFK